MVFVKFSAFVSLCVMFLGCGDPVLISERNVHEFDDIAVETSVGFSLTVHQFYDRLFQSSLVPGGGIIEKDQLRRILDSIVLDTLIDAASYELDLKKYPENYKQFARRSGDQMINRLFEKVVADEINFDSADVADHYYGTPELYYKMERIIANHILIDQAGLIEGPDSLKYKNLSDEEMDRATADYARFVWGLLGKDRIFVSIASEYSHDPHAARSDASLGIVERRQFSDPFDSVAFSLQSDEYSDPYKDDNGWHIIYVSKHMSEGIPELDEVLFKKASNNLREKIAAREAALLRDSLRRNSYDIVYNEPMLDTNYFKIPANTWLATVNEIDTIFAHHLLALEVSKRESEGLDNTYRFMKEEIIHRAAEWWVLNQAAHNMGIDTLPDVVQQMNAIRRDHARPIVIRDRYDASWLPPDSMIKRLYKKHLVANRSQADKPLTVQQILCGDSAVCEFVRDQALSGIDFLELAERYYDADQKKRRKLADVGDIGEGDVSPELWKAAFLARVGSASKPFKTAEGWRIVKVSRHYFTPGLSKFRSSILTKLRREHNQQMEREFRENLFTRYNVRHHHIPERIHLKPLEDRIG